MSRAYFQLFHLQPRRWALRSDEGLLLGKSAILCTTFNYEKSGHEISEFMYNVTGFICWWS